MYSVIVKIMLVVLLAVLNTGNGLPTKTDAGPDFEPHIIGGVPAPVGHSPHMAGLIFGAHVLSVMCGGSIITKTLVLTAAHCIDPFILEDGSLQSTFHITVGSNQWNSGGIAHQISTYHNHPQWDPKNIKYDAGILVLIKELLFNPKVNSIKLDFDWTNERLDCYVTGWGGTGPTYEDNVVNLQPTPRDLQLLYLSTIPWQQCQKAMAVAALENPMIPHIEKDVEICTFHSVGHGMCNGESGSALVRCDREEQIGIVSWGNPCAVGAPDVFTRVFALKPFLLQHIRKYSRE